MADPSQLLYAVELLEVQPTFAALSGLNNSTAYSCDGWLTPPIPKLEKLDNVWIFFREAIIHPIRIPGHCSPLVQAPARKILELSRSWTRGRGAIGRWWGLRNFLLLLLCPSWCCSLLFTVVGSAAVYFFTVVLLLATSPWWGALDDCGAAGYFTVVGSAG